MKAQDMPCVTVEQVLRLRDHASYVEQQRDQLREALKRLEEMASDCDDGQYMDYPDARGIFEQARAALKATEE